jgi:hypothetical protein
VLKSKVFSLFFFTSPMAQSEEGTASPSAAGGGANQLEDGFVPVPKDEPISPAPVRAHDRLTLRLARQICRRAF